jgi:hypothetical protein
VQLAGCAEQGGRTLHKALDGRHENTIKRFDKAKTAQELSVLWDEARRSGDIPGAYWAVLTHRATTPDVRQVVFGDVHMLSHLVGAANRADIRRLAALEVQNAELQAKIDKQQAQLRDAIVWRDESIKRLTNQVAAQIARSEGEAAEPSDAPSEVQTLRELVASLHRRLETATARCDRAERRADAARADLVKTETALRLAQELERAMRAELDAAEADLLSLHGTEENVSDRVRSAVQARTVLYVGGRPKQIQAIRSLVEAARGGFIHHDGGLEDRKGLLASDVHRADLVFFPVDCVSHDAVAMLKRTCQSAGKPYRPLRTTSVASFVAALHGATWSTSSQSTSTVLKED